MGDFLGKVTFALRPEESKGSKQKQVSGGGGVWSGDYFRERKRQV